MSREYKISSIHEADDAINNLNMKLWNARRQVNDEMQRVERRAAQQAQNAARAMVTNERIAMQNAMSREIAGVNQSIRDLDNAHRRRLQSLANDLDGKIEKEADKLRHETQTGLEAVNKRIDMLARSTKLLFEQQQRELDSHQSQLNNHQRQIDDLRSTVNGILEELNDEQLKRQEAVKMAKAAYDAAFKRTDIDRFNPEEAHRLHDRMRHLTASADSYTAASQAIELIMNIQWAEEEAVKQSIIYNAVRAQTIELAEKILAEVKENRNVTISNPNDPLDTTVLEVDFWNHGEYHSLQGRVEELRKELDSQPSMKRIHEIADEMAEGEVKLNEMVKKACERAILSENRVLITEDIITALQNQGWQVEQDADGSDEVGYEGGETDNDWREGVYAYLHSVNGERIVIRITPSDDEKENDIAFHRIDNRSLTANEYMRSLQTMKAQIEKSGHKLGDFKAPVADGGNKRIEEVTSSYKLSKKGAAQSIRQQMKR